MSAIKKVVLSVYVFCHLNSFGQSKGTLLESSLSPYCPFSVVHYGTKDGIPQNQILDIIQKKSGDLLLATANGIVEFDGAQFQQINTPATYKRFIHSQLFFHEKSSTIYGLDYQGALNVLNKKFYTLRSTEVVDFQSDSLFSYEHGQHLRIVSAESQRVIYDSKLIFKNALKIIYFKGECYIGGEDGLIKKSLKTGKTSTILSKPISFFEINKRNGRIYYQEGNNLYELTPNVNTRKVNLDHPLDNLQINEMAFIEDDFFIGTTGGLYYCTPYFNDFFDKSNFLPSNYIQSLLYLPDENCLMVGTGNKGLLKLQLKSCNSITEGSNIDESSLSSIVRNPEGKILVAGANGTIFSVTIGDIRPYIKSNQAYSTLACIDNYLLAGTWGRGVFIYQGDKQISQVNYPHLLNGNVHSIFKDSRGNVWIGNSGGVSMGKTFASIKPVLPQEIGGRIICIYELRNGNICLGGSNGIYVINKKGVLVEKLQRSDGLHCKEVRSFHEDQEGKLWIGTYDGGLYCFANGELRSINRMPNCMLADDVFTLAMDSRGNILMTSNNGLSVVKLKKLNEFYYGKSDFLVPFLYGREDGIFNTEFNGGFQNNFLKGRHDHFYFPTIEGILITMPDDLIFRKLAPRIAEIYVDEKKSIFTIHKFSRDTKQIEFRLSCPTYLPKYNFHYQYSLTSPNKPLKWTNLYKENSVRFTLLPPGDYVFSFRAIDGMNDPHPTVTSFSFTIKPYFYETKTIQFLSILFITILILILIRIRVNKVRKTTKKQNEVENQLLTYQLQTVQSKMNPHFIFNSLNTINYLLSEEKFSEAESMLEEFSQLLRDFLQRSDREFIEVSEELKIIELYLKIEQKRFNKMFDFQIMCPSSLMQKLIPTMLIQPFIENAIKHGIAHLQSKGEILLAISRSSKGIKVVIEDNGVGRNASLKINANSKRHKSMGIWLVNEKIRLVYKQYQIKIEMQIEDIEENKGTRVVILIPHND